MAFLFSFGISAFAAEDKTTKVEVYTDSTTGDITQEVGNVTVSDAWGVDIYSEDGTSVNLTTGNVESYGVYAGAEDNGSVSTLTVNGDITNDKYGIYTDANYGATVNVDVSGNVTGDYGIYSDDAYDGSTTNINIGGNLTSNYYNGIHIDEVDENSTVNITVGGNVVSISNGGIHIGEVDEKSTAKITVGGNVVSN